ncbi:hypothetical protein GUJ93_ZPchr0014g46807 [Zizania palustris]|uniref:GATA-type domain-containing protein n=1 Tax=Zizania palustris TaxID=103762 RepID=A0A8J5TC59_ZIZPA|nr:hypothetical protein GUJ93_ZPchr0014g46807 [Zizania palustris]
MGKQGPCCHCGVTSTPLWRNGPPDKPVLCNACGSRWRTKGSLMNYTPMHARDDIDAKEPGASKLKPLTFKLKEHKQLKKKPSYIAMENGPFSDQNFRKMGDADPTNRSGSGSALSYSSADASEMTASAQSHAWESLVPSKKRSSVTHPKPSPMEKLAKDLNTIMHEEQLLYLSGSSEEDLLYYSETPVDSFEISYGSMLLKHPNSKPVEEESEASSVHADNKSNITTGESYSGSASFVVYSENKGTCNPNVALEQPKKLPVQTPDNATRAKLHNEKQDNLENPNTPLVSIDIEGKDSEEKGGQEKTSASKRLTRSTMNPLKRPHDTHLQSSTELRGIMRSPKKVSKFDGIMGLNGEMPFLPKPGMAIKDLACTGRSSLNLFMLPPDKLSMLVPPLYTNGDSDQDLLLDVPLNARHPDAELCCQPSQLSSVSHSSTSDDGIAEGERRLKHP